jgi:hypothetical protein
MKLSINLQYISVPNKPTFSHFGISPQPDKLRSGLSAVYTLRMPETHGWSRYDHLKAIFSRRASQESAMKDDSRSEITLVSGYVSPRCVY